MKKIVSMFFAIVMLFNMTGSTFAADTNTQSIYPDMTKEEAMELLGLLEEEMEDMPIYRLSPEEDGISILNLPRTMSRGVYYEDITAPANFTGVIHTLDGTKFTWGASLLNDIQGNTNNNAFVMHIILQYTTGYVIDTCDIDQKNSIYNPDYWWKIAGSKQIYFKYSYATGSGYTANVKQTLRIAVGVY